MAFRMEVKMELRVEVKTELKMEGITEVKMEGKMKVKMEVRDPPGNRLRQTKFRIAQEVYIIRRKWKQGESLIISTKIKIKYLISFFAAGKGLTILQ